MPFPEFPYGANQSAKTFTLRGAPSATASSVLGGFAEQAVIRGPRSFAHERLPQGLRHAATSVKVLLEEHGVQDYQEVQVGVDEKNSRFLVSTNTNRANAKLETILRGIGGKGKPTMRRLAGRPRKGMDPHKNREDRHMMKLRKLRGFGAKADWPIDVTKRVASKMDGLHAERRIIAEAAAVAHVRGIKRPCAHCFPRVHPSAKKDDGTGPGPGPRWESGAAARGGVQPSRFLTRVTRDRAKRITVDHGSDSDSDA